MAWSRTSRHQRGYGTAWDKLRKCILARDKHLCQPCLRTKRTKAGNQVDHIKPKATGGTDDETNLQCICADCHTIKTAEESGRPLRQHISVEQWLADE